MIGSDQLSTMPATDRRDLLLCLVVCACLLALVWAEPRSVDELFIALAGGRDVVAGHLEAPDDWSFTTEGRVWLQQSWASDLLFYATNAAAGERGLLALKALLLTTATALLALAARARGVAWPLALLVAAVTFAACRTFIELGPSLVGLALASGLLWTLTRAASRPGWLWLAVALLGVWANAHDGFIVGLGLMALWTLASTLTAPRVLPTAILALIAAMALAAFANPFGLVNLTHPLLVAASPIRRDLALGAPLFPAGLTSLGSRWEICTLPAVFLLLLLARLVAGRRSRTEVTTEIGADLTPRLAVFDAIAILVLAALAVWARHFVPFALMVLSGPLAAQLAWWQRRFDSGWPTRLLALGLLLAVVLAAPPVVRRYRADNPIFAGTSTFGRMVDALSFPAGPSEFLRSNGITGRAYASWEWEGYLRWNQVPVTVLVGGRGQQVYDEATLQLDEDLRAGTTTPRDALAARRVGLAILPMTAAYSVPLGGLVYAEESPWTYLYCDGRQAVLIDTSEPELAATVAALEAGTLRYPSPAIAATSRMMHLASPRSGAEIETIRSAAEDAARSAPTALAYAVIADLAISTKTSSAPTRAYLAAERQRLAGLAAERGNDLALAQARLGVARTEGFLVGRTVDPEGVARTRDELALRTHDMRTLLATWAYGWDPNVF